MSNIEKIKVEIERLKKILTESTYYLDNSQQALGYSFALDDFKEFIDSLPEGFPPYCTGIKGYPDPAGTSDLEEAAEEYASKTLCDPDDGPSTGLAKESFIAGTEWQRVQDEPYMKRNNLELSFMLENARKGGILEGKAEMMKDAVEGEIGYWNQRGLSIRLDQSLERLGYDEDTKVKIIIVKQ